MAAHNEVGRWGENTARRYLLLHGYHILDVDWHWGHRDIDVVTEKLGFIIFVEVKTRTTDTYMDPKDAVDTEKIRNLLAAGNAYMNLNRIDMPCQFDILTIVGDKEHYKIEHLKEAFDGYNWSGRYEYKGKYGGAPQTNKL